MRPSRKVDKEWVKCEWLPSFSIRPALWSTRNPIPSSQQTKLSPHWLFQVMPQIILLGKEEIRSRFETDLEVERKRELKVKSKQCSHMYVTESQIRKGILLLFLISSHWEKYFYLYGVSLFTETYMYLWEFAPNFSSISWRDPWHVTHAYMSLGSNHAFLLEGGRTGEEEEYVMWRQIERDMKSRHRQIRAIWSILHLVNNIFRGQLGSETSQKELSLPFIAFSDRPLEEFTLWAVTVTLLYNR